MLTKGDLRYVFYTFSFVSRVWKFPAKFHKSSTSFHIPSKGRGRLVFRIVLAVTIAHAMLLSGRTFQAGAISRDTPLEFLALGILASITGCGLCLMGILVHQNLEIQVKIWTELINRLDQSGRASPFHKKTWEELWICYMPFFIHSIGLVWPVVYSVNPNLPFLLYGNVPAILKGTPALVLCCLTEVVMTTFYSSMSIYYLVSVTTFARQMRIELQSLKDKLVRFGINQPECGSPAKNVPEPIRLLEIEEGIQPESRVMVDGRNNRVSPINNEDEIQVICEVNTKPRNSRTTGHVRHELKIKEKNPVNKRQRGDLKGGETADFQGGSKKLAKGVKNRLLKGAENWIVGKAEEWAAKKGETWAGKRVGKWAAKRSGKWAVKKTENWLVKAEESLAQKTEEKGLQETQGNWTPDPEAKRTAARDEERIIKLEMEVIRAITETTPSEELRSACKTLEVFRLLFRLFNEGYANTVFILKMLAIAVSIWGMFGAIRVAGNHPEFAVLYGLIGAVCVCNYIGMFNNAFHLTGQAEAIKSLILLHSTTLLNWKQQTKEEWNEIRCRIAAIPKLAIYSGHFHALERDSVPVFIHFILNKLADLLLAF